MAADLDPELVQQPPREGAGGHPGGGLPGAGALEDVAGVHPIVLEHSHEVGVTGPRAGDTPAAQLPRPGLVRHDVLPVAPVAVGDEHGHRGAERLAGPHAGEPLDVIALDLHPRPAAVALHPAVEVAIHPLGC